MAPIRRASRRGEPDHAEGLKVSGPPTTESAGVRRRHASTTALLERIADLAAGAAAQHGQARTRIHDAPLTESMSGLSDRVVTGGQLDT